jgi:hypothetical protein
MASAYCVVLDREVGFDASVNGKAIARESTRLAKIAMALGIRSPDDFVSMNEEAAAFAEEFDLDGDNVPTGETWFDAAAGLQWVRTLQGHLQADPDAVKDASAVLADLAEFESVLSQAQAASAKWRLAVDH